MTLRAEFEPLLIGPRGFCRDPESCAASWDHYSEEVMQRQVRLSEEWLRHQKRLKHFSHKFSSYGHKHRVEDWHSGKVPNNYVSNGAFIIAAVRLGFLMKRIRNGPNAIFNITPVTEPRNV